MAHLRLPRPCRARRRRKSRQMSGWALSRTGRWVSTDSLRRIYNRRSFTRDLRVAERSDATSWRIQATGIANAARAGFAVQHPGDGNVRIGSVAKATRQDAKRAGQGGCGSEWEPLDVPPRSHALTGGTRFLVVEDEPACAHWPPI